MHLAAVYQQTSTQASSCYQARGAQPLSDTSRVPVEGCEDPTTISIQHQPML